MDESLRASAHGRRLGAGGVRAKTSEPARNPVARFSAEQAHYQNRAYADRYRDLVRTVQDIEPQGRTALSAAVAASLFKLIAYRDEYEVARFYAETDFLDRIKAA